MKRERKISVPFGIYAAVSTELSGSSGVSDSGGAVVEESEEAVGG